MSDNELDKLFKEAADGFNAPQDPTAWKSMASKLDQAAPVATSFWNWKTVSTMAVVGIASVSLVWLSVKSNDQTRIQSDKPNQVVEGTANTVAPPGEGTTQAIPSASGQKTQENLNSSQAVSESQKEVPENEKILEQRSTVAVVVPGEYDDNKEPTITNVVREDEKVVQVNEQKLTGLPSVAILTPEKTAEQPVTGQKAQPVLNENSTDPNDSLEAPRVESKVAVTDIAETMKKDERSPEADIKVGPAISIKAAISPDFSSIKFSDPAAPGFNYGVMIGYSFNNRWSVYTGAISSRKIYTSSEIEEPYTTSGGYDYEVNQLDGDCRVLDIPVNVYYNFFPERSFSLKAGIGFSSYLMFKENYTFYVDKSYGNDTYHVQIDHENNEWFKMLNVSVILQKKLKDHFYFELEPFLKAPLAGVGEGEVSLVSLGAFLNLRFDIPIKKP